MRQPPPETVEAWAYRFVVSCDLSDKLAPDAPPTIWADREGIGPIFLEKPGRPPELEVRVGGHRTPGLKALRQPEARARLLHTFLHHELQAAELMCRALLAHPDTPLAFRRGLIGICQDEVRHMSMYQAHLHTLGFRYGDFPVNDWFWRKLPAQCSALAFVSLMGLGFEGANLDHTQRFADQFRKVGDEAGAALQEQVGREEIPHVAFGAHWFEQFSGQPLNFETWTDSLPPPLSPLLLKGKPLQREARRRAGFSDAFIDALAAYTLDA